MTGAGTSGVWNIDGSPAGPCVYSSDVPDSTPNDALTHDLIARLGLTPVPLASATSADAVLMTYHGTRLRCRWGSAPHADLLTALSASGAVQSVGDVSSAPPAQPYSLAIDLVGAYPDRSAQLIAIQHLCCATAMLSAALGAKRMFWPPAALWSSTSELGSAIAAMEAEGLPPVLHLVAFRYADGDHGRSLLTSRGLALFIGAELQLDYPTNFGGAEAVRRLARLAIHAMIAGPPGPKTHMPGILPDELLTVGSWSMDATGAPDGALIPIQLNSGCC